MEHLKIFEISVISRETKNQVFLQGFTKPKILDLKLQLAPIILPMKRISKIYLQERKL